MSDRLFTTLGVFVIYFMLSVMASVFKAEFDNCDKDYPIDYVLYTNLFCEIDPPENSDE